MRKWLFTVMLLFCVVYVNAQSGKFIVRFANKNNNPYSIQNPSMFLSQKAIQRRARQNIPIDESDLPITPIYLQTLNAIQGVKVLNTSKWLNQALVFITDTAILQQINTLPFVVGTAKVSSQSINTFTDAETINSNRTLRTYENSRQEQDRVQNNVLQYGASAPQIEIHHGQFLHNKGFTGRGMTIAILDEGFYHYQSIRFFDSVRLQGRILGTWDFVNNEESVNEDGAHGMVCLSTLAANIPGEMIGSAPHANYYLFRTEDAATESPVEEQNWAAAAELADSLGVDMISSSLGYNTFDNPAYNYTYAQMNGKTTIITRATVAAANKGILITNSAGNQGRGAWKYITAPADAPNILTVGATNTSGVIAPFSSWGPSADGAIKPDIVSVGWQTKVVNTNGDISSGNGTSFSNPNVNGLIACLWQAFPNRTAQQIIDVVRKSSDKYINPDNQYGYGIPNFATAYRTLFIEDSIKNISLHFKEHEWSKVFPNPFNTSIQCIIRNANSDKATCSLVNILGQTVAKKIFPVNKDIPNTLSWEIPSLAQGVYFMTITCGDKSDTHKLIKM